MFPIIIFIVGGTSLVKCNYLEVEPNYQKPKLERNNIVNKGVWIRNKYKENLFDKARIGEFIFRENSLDVDNLLQNNFDAFNANYMQDSPLVSSYVKRTKRAARGIREQLPRKSVVKNCIGKACNTLTIEEPSEMETDPIKSKPESDLATTSALNDYPYEVAILLNNNKNKSNASTNDKQISETDINRNNYSISEYSHKFKDERFSTDTGKKANNTRNVTSPKRSMKYDFETEIIKKFELTEDVNGTRDNDNDSKIMDRNIFDKDNTAWRQNAPIPDVNVYKVVPKEPPKNKPVTERGLIKVISMLTKTFKKIMKQHNEIKDIYARINDVNEDFLKNTASMTNKFQDFDLKYLYLLKFHEKLKLFDSKLTTKQEYFKNKERELTRNFKEFENQQKKFLQQQRQFYNIQKLMLAQNEKINMKQNLIAKTQSEISHRQNNFARILKKAKQLYVESRNPGISKLSSSINKVSLNQRPELVIRTTTTVPTTEPVKINLFSIPISNKIENQDDLIIREKDEQNIDDLVYKYYFNNTFIDNMMKNNVLTSFIGNSESSNHARNVKTKRNELETTILLPVSEANESEGYIGKTRERRWINHHSRHKNKRRERGKGMTVVMTSDAKPLDNRENNSNNTPAMKVHAVKKSAKKATRTKHDPFLTMAQTFCNEIHQNMNSQMLRWCVEKALRRLQFLDTKSPPLESLTTSAAKPVSPPTNTKLNPLLAAHTEKVTMPGLATNTLTNVGSSVPVTDTTASPITSSVTIETTTLATRNVKSPCTSTGFFPDNEQLESNLKQFEDMKPDTEGNVYYEGSVHASEILDSESQGIDDIIPGLESNSRVDMDPLAFDLQAQRRAFVRKLNEKIKLSLG